MKATKTNSELNECLPVLAAYVNGENKETKLAAKLRQQMKIIGKALKPYNEACEDARLDTAATDDKNNLIKEADGINYKRSKEGEQTLFKKLRELADVKVEIAIVYTSELAGQCENMAIREYLFEFLGVEEKTE